jgi:WbqC-like protein family
VKVGIIQSSFIPWRGYFDFIASVDKFVLYDDVQFSKGSWRNRNRIKTAKGTEWLSVPVRHEAISQLIQQTKIDYTQNWAKKILGSWRANYAKAPYFAEASRILTEIESCHAKTISELNIKLTKRLCDYLNIATPMLLSTEFSLSGTKTERLIDLLKRLNATTYLSGPSADAYLDKESFRANGIQLEFKSYDYEPYPQLWGEFEGAVTVLDLIANCGHAAPSLFRSRTPNRVVISRT